MKITKHIIDVFRKMAPKTKSFIKKIINAKINWLGKINDLSYKKIISIYLVLFCLGRILLFYDPIRCDWIHQIVLTAISLLIVYSLKYAYIITEKIKEASAGLIFHNRKNNCTSKTLKMFADQMINTQQSIWPLIIMIFPAVGFIRKNIHLEFVERTPAGYYAVIFAASTFYLALLGYVQIVVALVQFYKISHDKDECIPLDFPHDAVSPPEWLSLWNQLFQKIIKIFFLVGTLFTLEYVLLMPKDVVTIDNGKCSFNVCDVKSFLLSWGTIFVFIIIAFPIINFEINKMKTLLIQNLGKKISREYRILFEDDFLSNSPLDMWAYKQLIESSGKYNNYFHTARSIIPIASTLLSFLLNVIKFYEGPITECLKLFGIYF